MADLHYARADGLHLAYRVHDGAGERDVVVFTPGGTIPMDALEQDRIGARLIAGLSAIGRLLLFDRRGIGLSDPITDWQRPLVEQWADDLAAVITEAALERPVVVALGDYWGPARLFAARHPGLLSRLVLYEPHGPVEAVDLRNGVQARMAEVGGAGDWIAVVCPSRAHDVAFHQWFDNAGRSGASPAVAARVYDRPDGAIIEALRDAERSIEVPTLVLRRPENLLGSPAPPDPVAESITDCRSVALSGRDYHWLGEDVDSLLAEISRFVTGESRLPAPERVLCAVLFTDLVGSTERLSTVGDARWKVVLDRHDAVIREEVGRSGGTVLKHTGDGVLATLPSADRALRTAAAIRTASGPR